jgi:hypothetical protein
MTGRDIQILIKLLNDSAVETSAGSRTVVFPEQYREKINHLLM